MSELDFDELDKAVNTLMGDVPKSEPVKTEEIKTLNITSSLPPEGQPSFEKLDSVLSEVNSVKKPATEKPVTTPTVALPSLATRRSGRFMDVVHPSSDMSGMQRPVRPMSRQGVNLQPSAITVPEQLETEPKQDEDKVDLDVTPFASEQKQTTNELASQDAPQNDWPDPLEMSSSYNTEPATVADSAKVEPDLSEDQPGDDELFTIDDSGSEENEEAQPLTSPFIADAKVEKRPLGGAPAEDTVDEPGHAPVLGVLATDDLSASDPVDQLPVSPREVEPQLPPELRSDLMAIETDGGTSPDAAVAVESPAPEAPAKTETAQVAPVQPSEAPAQSMPKPSSIQSVVPAGPTSIPQQYQEEPSTSDEPNGSIYDTDSYHQPLAHPAKTKSGWLWVIWILLLLIVGGGGAVALYFLGII